MKKEKPEKDNLKKKLRKNRIVSTIMAIFIVICIIIGCSPTTRNAIKNSTPKEIKYEKFLKMTEDNKVKRIIWSDNKDTFTFYDTKNKIYSSENPKYDDFKKDMLEKGIDVKETGSIGKYETPIMIIIQLLMYGVFFGIMVKTMGLSSGIFGKKEKETESKIRFSDVAGLDEVKEDLMTVVDFLKNPEQYKEAGAEIPKGVLLYGPPGTGKTLLAKAVAGEAGVKFKAVSGSDFDEKYVGVGASKMRKLFDEAKENAPCIIFIDEIDSMGGRRHSKQSNYDRQTLNTLLSEMDGFDGSGGVVVIAATNRIEDLDPALTRPGRFDNHFAVNLPATAKERKIIVDLYAKNKKFSDDVNMENFVKETMGSSPATIKTVLNEAAIIAARKNEGIITREILDEAWMKQLMEGHLKKNGEKDNVELVAWHEAGHALAGLMMGQDLTKVSIIPSTSGAGGATFITPKKLGLFTVDELREQVIMLYSGRNAEQILSEQNGIKNGVTTGASNDIEKATDIIKKMITEYGMNEEFGLLNLEGLDVKPEIITKEAVKLAQELKEVSYSLLASNIEKLKMIAEKLIEKETLTGEEVKNIAGE